MMWKQALLIAAGCALLSWPAYSQTPSSADMPKSRDSVPSSPSTDMKAPPTGTAATDTMAATRPSREALLLGKIHHDNQAEIELANLAKQNSSSDAVKKFADRIVADHSKADEQVVALAQSKNIDIDKLRNLKGAEFDREFARAMVNGHQKAIDELTRARSQINDTEMVSLIDKLLPKFKQHLSMAQKLQDNLKS